jgi:hypothetical protein
MDRFLKYTSGREPVITVNLVAAIMFGIVLTVLERSGVTLSETELVLLGSAFLAVATWLARRNVFSPEAYYEDVDAALHEEPPKPE